MLHHVQVFVFSGTLTQFYYFYIVKYYSVLTNISSILIFVAFHCKYNLHKKIQDNIKTIYATSASVNKYKIIGAEQ